MQRSGNGEFGVADADVATARDRRVMRRADQARKLAHGLGVNLSDLIAVCEGSLTVEELTDALELPEGVSLVGRRRKSQAPGKDITARAERLGFEVLRVVDEVMQARLTPETRGRKRRVGKRSKA